MINNFSKKYFFLSNFSKHGFIDKFDIKWKTSEHYYQSHKATCKKDALCIHAAPTARDAKKTGRNIKISPTFEKEKDLVMSTALHYKFDQNPEIRNKLIDTGDQELVEGNSWHDNIWGDCSCPDCSHIKGENRLGKMLMKLRENYKKEGRDQC